MAMPEFDSPELRAMEAFFESPATSNYKEDHLQAILGFHRMILHTVSVLEDRPDSMGGPFCNLEDEEGKVDILWEPRQLHGGKVRLKVDTEDDDEAEIDEMPASMGKSIMGIVISGLMSGNPMASIISEGFRPKSVQSFTGPERTKMELYVVKRALLLPTYLKTWGGKRNEGINLLNSKETGVLRYLNHP